MNANHDRKPRSGCSQGTILVKALRAIRMPQKIAFHLNQLHRSLENAGDIPHPFPHFSGPLGFAPIVGKAGAGFTKKRLYNGASTASPCKRRY
ncbi:hypothetical protein PDR5_21280 [Pseudomonas sp. DR 5-09]|nr:hypothetical protein PDR5_21280 [Pseudomonas sp. DR 5-09]